ncbi:hypothetical protein FRC08_015945 [Ceratobasidium sp. 394]|nr:hypothetical protein FRC08_015945 [Ceratobasidium sp. 394]
MSRLLLHACLIVTNKNVDEIFQNFACHTQFTDFSRGRQEGNVPPSQRGPRRDISGKPSSTNSEARKLLSGLTPSAAACLPVAFARSPTRSVSRPGSSSTSMMLPQWRSANGKLVGSNEALVLQAKNPAGEGDIQYHYRLCWWYPQGHWRRPRVKKNEARAKKELKAETHARRARPRPRLKLRTGKGRGCLDGVI